MSRQISISEARARLPELARRIAGSPGRVEYIAHRDLDEDLAMTTRSHLRFLEDSLEALRRRSPGDFRLAESMSSDLSDREVEAGLVAARSEASGAAEAKREGMEA